MSNTTASIPTSSLLVATAADRISSAVNREIIRTGRHRSAAGRRQGRGTPLPATRTTPDLRRGTHPGRGPRPGADRASITWFYGIAVLALIVQQVTVTHGRPLDLPRRPAGLVELFRLSPIRSGELLIGKYIAIGLVSGIVAAALITLLVGAFRVPVLGDPAAVIIVVALLDRHRDRARAADRAGLRFGATGGPTDPPGAPGVRLLRRARREPGTPCVAGPARSDAVAHHAVDRHPP